MLIKYVILYIYKKNRLIERKWHIIVIMTERFNTNKE